VALRPAVAADVPGIVEAYLRSWRAAYAGSLAPDRLDREAAARRDRHPWASCIAAPGVTVRVGIDAAGRVLGVVQADRSVPERDRAELTMLYVDPDAWGTGLAAELLAAGVGWLAEQGCDHAWLRVVEDHRRARRFYEREGWHHEPSVAPVPTALARLVTYRRSL
jgi:GNAT superfamily N-acetyltransferase